MRELSRGQILGQRFTLIRRLGEGGMGQVWLARDEELREQVALKVLAPELAGTAALIESLRREFHNTQRLVHPNIVRVFGFHETDDFTFLSLEYVNGGDLARFRGGDTRENLARILPLVAALEYAHEAGVVHRDLKLSNVLCDGAGTPRLADFGVASAFAEGATAVGWTGGTPGAMSPEQARGDPAHPADDVFGLGALIAELISGAPPADEDLDAIAQRDDLPEGLVELLRDMLAPSRSARIASMAEIDSRLRRCLDGPGTATLPPVRPAVRPDEAFATIAPLAFDRGAGTMPRAAEKQNRTVHAGIAAAFGLVLLAAAVAVFVVLPRTVAERQSQPVAAAAPGKSPATAAATGQTPDGPVSASGLTPYQLVQLTREKQAAEAVLEELIAIQQKLEDMAVTAWAEADFEAARARAEAGDRWFATQKFVSAGENYAAAAEMMKALQPRGERLRDDSIAAGWAAFEQADAPASEERFAFALRIDAENEEAARGLSRAQSLPDVLRLMAEGQDHERAGAFGKAGAAYREASGLDGEYAAAREAAQRMAARIGNSKFAAAMSKGFAELGQRRFAAARQAFEGAQALRPGSTEASDALAQVALEERIAQIETHRASAQEFEAAERWQQAAEHYATVRSLDPGLIFAREGEMRSRDMAATHERVDRLIDQPERLAAGSVAREAAELLGKVRSGAVGPLLLAKANRLEELLALAQTPVRVVLKSDNETEVLVQQVERLGRFDTREMLLRPGKYTAVGTRVGFRDVRRNFTVVAGQPPPPVVVRCEERI